MYKGIFGTSYLFFFSSQNYRTPSSCLAPVELLRGGKGAKKNLYRILKDDLVQSILVK